MPEGRAAEYRQKAQECREQAVRASKPDERAAWIEMAERWLDLAYSVEHELAIREGRMPPRRGPESSN